MEGAKSSLNPNAAPYVPLGKQLGFEGDNTVCKEDFQNQSADFPVPGGSKDAIFSGDSSFHDEFDFFDSASLEHEFVETTKETLVENFKLVADVLSYAFPDISSESLAEVFYMNNGHYEDTLSMLHQLESLSISSDSNACSPHGAKASSIGHATDREDGASSSGLVVSEDAGATK